MTIIMDSSSDLAMHHTMIIYLQLIEKNRPVVMFYKLIEMGSDGRAATIVKQIIESFEEDGILDRMKLLLKGFSSDGENLMLGSRGGVAVLLEAALGTELYKVHCAAHRLNLMAAHGLKTKDGVLDQMESFMNRIYAYYHASPKRVNQLKELAEEMGIDFIMLAQYKKIRWSAAELAVMRKVLATRDLLLTDMEATIADRDTSQSVRRELRSLVSLLTNKNVLLYLYFFEDVLSDLSEYSKIFQQKLPLVIGKEQLLLGLRAKLAGVSRRPLPKLMAFVTKCECHSLSIYGGKCHSLAEFQQYRSVECDKRMLIDAEFVENFNAYRDRAPQKLLAAYDQFFPERTMSMFSALDPNLFPTTDEEMRQYGDVEIGEMAKRFKYSESTVLEWQSLIEKMYSDQELCQVKESGTVVFWKHFLDKHDIEFPEVSGLIKTALSLSFSSAEAERGFSVVKWLRSGRHSLTVDNLSHRLRVHLNGPRQISAFPAKVLARKWIGTGHVRSDDPFPRRESAPGEEKLRLLPENTIIYG